MPTDPLPQAELRLVIHDVPLRPQPERTGVHDARGLAAYVRHVATAIEHGATSGELRNGDGVIGRWNIHVKDES